MPTAWKAVGNLSDAKNVHTPSTLQMGTEHAKFALTATAITNWFLKMGSAIRLRGAQMTDNAILEFAKKISRQTYYSSIPTTSAHGKLATDIINSFLIDHPEYHPTISCLVVYPLQFWASACRKKLRIDTDILIGIQNDEVEADYLGFIKSSSLVKQTRNLSNSDEILRIVREMFEVNKLSQAELKALKAIHDPEAEDTSKFIIGSHYENALLKICKQYNGRIKRTDKAAKKDTYAGVDAEMQVVYHNSEVLASFIPVMKKASSRSDSSVDFEASVRALNDCIETLKTYPVGGEEIYPIVHKWANGVSEPSIARSIGKSRNYVRARRDSGLQALAILLWGYTTIEK